MNVQEKDTRVGCLEAEIQEIEKLNVEENGMIYSFTVNYTPFFSVVCC